ncbi:OmpH family outer membrane protein [uncultured Tateyamaria sp.]|uniref:OmpH family outer membrane protein n=1 Tax=uncultured Tateyamaria sp. TaxID=455651 RepID=UPI00262B5EED|nr:OmpH family outer membrane protein [uncultured Tateyamaria sp.]
MGDWLRRLCLAIALSGAVAGPVAFTSGPATAQDVRSPILTIDSDRLYRGSAFGQRVLREIEAQNDALADENRVLEQQLENEEAELTAQRDTLSAEEFRALADAFDARVQAIRRERENESRAISAQLENNRDRFLAAAVPVLEAIMREAGAGVVLEQRSVFISANAIDITDAAIARIDAALQDGTEPAAD